MSLDRATVKNIANLARLAVPDDEVDQLVGELSSILGFVEQLAEVDTEGVEPMTGVGLVELPWRPDVVADGECPDKVLENAPKAEDGFFVVPKMVE